MHFEEQRELAKRTNKTIKERNDKYLESVVLGKSNQQKIYRLGLSKIGDTVNLRKLTDNNTIDKVADVDTSPYTVTTVEDTGMDYLLQLIDSFNQRVRAHVDRIYLFRTFDAAEVDKAASAPAAKKERVCS